jgi:cytochrome c oxidase cbb3-type subunit 4
MEIVNLLSDMRSAITVICLLTFLGIIAWAYSGRRASAFEQAANLPFADEDEDINTPSTEQQHG